MQASRSLHQSKCKPFQLCCMWVWRPRSVRVCVCSFSFLCLWGLPVCLISPCWNPCHRLNSFSNACASIHFVLITTAWCDLFHLPTNTLSPNTQLAMCFLFLETFILHFILLCICTNYAYIFHLTKSVHLLRIGTMFCLFIIDLVYNI